ncbi:MAG: hypothetical protein PHR83_15830 [Paludibacter sp.]|nr:hypothetical protein [Paludibacter sp.]
MKQRFILSILLAVFVLSSCNNEPKETYIDFDFYVDSIKNITATSATVEATLTIHKYGTEKISGLFIYIGRTYVIVDDSLYKEINFDKAEGTVEMTIKDLKPNTTYYIQPMARFNPTNKKPSGQITAFGCPYSEVTFKTLEQ